MTTTAEPKADQCWSLDGAMYHYDTLGELIDCEQPEAGTVVHVAEKDPADTSLFFDADDLVERLAEVAYDNHGEFAEDWPPAINQAAKDEFNSFLDQWIAKHCPPHFYRVKNDREYTVTTEDVQE